MKTKWKRIKILGTIKRTCKYCTEVKELILIEIVGKNKKLEYCKDCLNELYGINFNKKTKDLNS